MDNIRQNVKYDKDDLLDARQDEADALKVYQDAIEDQKAQERWVKQTKLKYAEAIIHAREVEDNLKV